RSGSSAATSLPVGRRRRRLRRRRRQMRKASLGALASGQMAKPLAGRSMSLPPFHLAFPVDDLAAARAFYGQLLGCPEGRSADHWVDFNLYGHQIVAHLAPGAARTRQTNPV